MTNKQHKLCMIPGPIEFHEDVLTAMSTPGTSHIDPAFIKQFGDCLKMLRQVILSKDAQPFILSGSGTLGWDSVVCNLMEKGEEALVINTGYFGDRFGECLETYGYKATHVKCPIGERPSLASIQEALEKKKYKLVNITHVDTSTGVLTNVKEICQLIRQKSPETLISVDGVCSIGGEELRMDDWSIDAVVTASQKALGAPSGLCIIWASVRALEVFYKRQTPVPNYFADWKHWLPIMKAYEEGRPSYFATPAVNLIMALHVSLQQLIKDGMEKRFLRHREGSQLIKDTLEKWGLKLVPKERQMAANTLTAVYYPDSFQPADLLPKVTQKGVVLAGGLHRDIASKYFRIGHMGLSAVDRERQHLETVLSALKSALEEANYQFKSE